MNDIIEKMTSLMQGLNIDYYYLINNAPQVTYPYCTGEFTQSEYSYEDNSNKGDFLLELWNRGSYTPLITLENTIKNYFRNLHVMKGNTAIAINYNASMPIETNEANLYKIEIHLDISYWEGEQ